MLSSISDQHLGLFERKSGALWRKNWAGSQMKLQRVRFLLGKVPRGRVQVAGAFEAASLRMDMMLGAQTQGTSGSLGPIPVPRVGEARHERGQDISQRGLPVRTPPLQLCPELGQLSCRVAGSGAIGRSFPLSASAHRRRVDRARHSRTNALTRDRYRKLFA